MAFKVHCIEDNQIMQNIYKRMMDVVDFAEEIIINYNGREAMDYYKTLLNSSTDGEQVLPDVILLDLNMPVMDGWSFLEEFNALDLPDSREPDIVIVTSSVNPDDKERAKKYPKVQAFLSKPLTIEKLEQLKLQMNGDEPSDSER